MRRQMRTSLHDRYGAHPAIKVKETEVIVPQDMKLEVISKRFRSRCACVLLYILYANMCVRSMWELDKTSTKRSVDRRSLCNIYVVVCHHFGEIVCLGKYVMTDYSAHFHEKFILKKSITFVKCKKQNVVWAHEFSWFIKKVVCTIYDVLGISALILSTILLHTFLHFFIKKNILNEWLSFTKLKKQNVVMCAWIFLVHQESRMYHISCYGVFRLSCNENVHTTLLHWPGEMSL